MNTFIPGIELSRAFYTDVVGKLVHFPHAAALLGEGSEVLGYDQPRSTDHSWGPRLQLFVGAARLREAAQALESGLPDEFKGYPVRFYSWQTGTVRHHVEVTTLDDWLLSQLRIERHTELTPEKWLAMPQQHLLQFTAGEVFRDDLGELTEMRRRFSQYPDDVWLWMMAAQWHLIGNAEPLLGRTVEAGDFRGSALIACRLVRLIMEMCFLQERRYWPYPKWFGTAFSKLQIAPALGPVLDEVLVATEPSDRHRAVSGALVMIAERHNALGVAPQVPPIVAPFQVGINDAVRPYRVLNAGSYAEACRQAIADETLRQTVAVGGIDQLTHADDALINFTSWPCHLEAGYKAELEIKPSGRDGS